MEIDIDTANEGSAAQPWCTAIGWVAASIQTTSPIVLIHGNNSSGAFFDRHGFTTAIQNQHLLYDNSIDMPTAPIQSNAAFLRDQLSAIVKSFGADKAHLIVHSKGGLDARAYLAEYAASDDFKVLSYTSLSTPHNGSPGADVLVQRSIAAKLKADRIITKNLPPFTPFMALLVGVDSGKPDLTTQAAAAFNAENLGKLPPPSDLLYNTVAADADQNSNAQIDNDPFEYKELLDDNGPLNSTYKVSSELARFIVDTYMYKLLRNTASAYLTFTAEPEPGLPDYAVVAVLNAVETDSPVPNDCLVTVPSGLGQGGMSELVKNIHVFDGPEGRNHSSIANTGVGVEVLPWLIEVEKERGDLRAE